MAFTPAIRITNRLNAAQTVTASVTPVTIQNSATDQFLFNLGAGKAANLVAYIPFTVAATGGFRWLLHCSATPTDYQTSYTVFDGTNAGAPLTNVISNDTEAAFANAFALAGNSLMRLNASIKANLATTVALQFACNTAANAITVIKGAWIDVELV